MSLFLTILVVFILFKNPVLVKNLYTRCIIERYTRHPGFLLDSTEQLLGVLERHGKALQQVELARQEGREIREYTDHGCIVFTHTYQLEALNGAKAGSETWVITFAEKGVHPRRVAFYFIEGKILFARADIPIIGGFRGVGKIAPGRDAAALQKDLLTQEEINAIYGVTNWTRRHVLAPTC